MFKFFSEKNIEPELGEFLKVAGDVLKHRSFVITEGWPELAQFEKEFGAFIGATGAAGVNSGTDALIFALRALGINAGDEVIVPAFSFISTASAVSWMGAKPVFADIRESDFSIDPSGIESRITPRTKAIVVAHLFGNPAPLDELLEIVAKRKIYLVEDAAQALGAKWRGDTVGTVGDVGCFSFAPTKHLYSFGSGGAVVSTNPSVIKRIKLMRAYGSNILYEDHSIVGINSALHELQAAFLRIGLRYLQERIERNIHYAKLYRDLLHNTGDIIHPIDESFPAQRTYYRYVIRTKERDHLFAFLNERLPRSLRPTKNYPVPLPYLGAFSDLRYKVGDFPIAEQLSREVISLPIGYWVRPSEVEHVAALVKIFFDRDGQRN